MFSTIRCYQIVPGTAFVRGLPPNVTKEGLQTLLARFGEITDCRIVMDKATRSPNGTAFVDFADNTAVKKASATSRREGKGILCVLAATPMLAHSNSWHALASSPNLISLG